jgi:hypothetical protein
MGRLVDHQQVIYQSEILPQKVVAKGMVDPEVQVVMIYIAVRYIVAQAMVDLEDRMVKTGLMAA